VCRVEIARADLRRADGIESARLEAVGKEHVIALPPEQLGHLAVSRVEILIAAVKSAAAVQRDDRGSFRASLRGEKPAEETHRLAAVFIAAVEFDARGARDRLGCERSGGGEKEHETNRTEHRPVLARLD